jgi:hypothetical protein
MDNLFKIRVLTAAVNEMRTASMTVYDRVFRGREHMEPTDRLAFDVISGSEAVLGNIDVIAPSTVTDKTSRKTITLTAPRLAQKRFIHTSELNALRAYGQQTAVEQMSTRIAREQRDMRALIDRTLEYWAVNALKGVIYDSDGTTELVNYNVDSSHKPTLTSTNKWSDTSNSDPVKNFRTWKRLIEDDTGTPITGWVCFAGYSAMDYLLQNDNVLDLLKYTKGVDTAESGRIMRLAGVEIQEYNGSYLDGSGDRQRFLGPEYVMLVGLCDDLVDVPYAPVVDHEAPGGVGNTNAAGGGVMFFSKSWDEKDPSGRWIKVETRPLPVLQRPSAVVYAKVA